MVIYIISEIEYVGDDMDGITPYSKVSDIEVINIFEQGIGGMKIEYIASATDAFIHSDNTEILQDRSSGYKLHVNVSEQDTLNFLKEAVPALGKANAIFKIWKPSVPMPQDGTVQQGKLLTIYVPSRAEAIRIISDLRPILSKCNKGLMPPNEKHLTDFVSYRYSDLLYDEPISNPWNPLESISAEQSRRGTKAADWARGLDERPKVVSGSDIAKGNAKIGDLVALRSEHGLFIPAELTDYDPKAKTVQLEPLSGESSGKRKRGNLKEISERPAKDLESRYKLETYLTTVQ